MNSLEYINREINFYDNFYERQLVALDIIKEECVGKKQIEEKISFCRECLNHLKQIKAELDVKETADELKRLLGLGVVFLPREFYDDYEGCLKGDGLATFVTKDLKIIKDFRKGWELLEEAVDGYDYFSVDKCKIAFVVWFNR